MGRLSKKRPDSKSKPSSQIVLTKKGTSRIERKEKQRQAAKGDIYMYLALGLLLCIAASSILYFILN